MHFIKVFIKNMLKYTLFLTSPLRMYIHKIQCIYVYISMI